MPRYVRVLESEANVPRVSDTRAEWEDVDELVEGIAGGGGGSVPVKASGAELDTGTDDAKFATAKALADSAYAKTTDITAAAVGLGNANNTSDANKPVSTATQTALNLKQDSLGFTPENVANKSTDITADTGSTTKYPCVDAVEDYVASAGGGAPFLDSTALVKGSADATKLFRIEVDGLTTGTTRVMTPPNANFSAARTDAAQTFTGDQTFLGKIIAPASLMPWIVAAGDEGTGWGYRAGQILSAYVASSEVLRVAGTAASLFNAGLNFFAANGTVIINNIVTELLTLSTGGATTATSGNLAPANSRIEAILIRVTTEITTATSFSIKVTGGNNFVAIGTGTSNLATLAAGSTYVLVPAAHADQYNSSATTLTVTANGGTPGAGAIRIFVVYKQMVPPDS